MHDHVKDPQYIGFKESIILSGKYGPRHIKMGLLAFKGHPESKGDRSSQYGSMVNMGHPILTRDNMGRVFDMVENISTTILPWSQGHPISM